MLPVARENAQGDCNGLRVYTPARGGRSCERFGGYKTINRIPLPLPLIVGYKSLCSIEVQAYIHK